MTVLGALDTRALAQDIRSVVETSTGEPWNFAYKGSEAGVDWLWAVVGRIVCGAHAYDDSVSTLPSGTTYYPEKWNLEYPMNDIGLVALLAHEAVHVLRMRAYPRWLRWLWFALYVALPFPLLFSWFRLVEEELAYSEQLLLITLTCSRETVAIYEDELRKEFTGPRYGWMGLWASGERWARIVDRAVLAARDPYEATRQSLLARSGVDLWVLLGPR